MRYLETNRISALLFLMLLTASVKTVNSQKRSLIKDTVFTQASILKIMKRVGDWQLQSWKTNGFKHKKTDWTNAALYTGLFDLSRVSGDEKYDQTLITIGNDVNWNTGSNRLMADDYCVGQTYSLLYMKYKRPEMITPFKHLADSIVSLPFNESLEWKNGIQNREWAWCDALFMGPTALAYLSTATGDLKYLDKAVTLWKKTTDYLYDQQAHLYSRDGSYLNKKEKNGTKVFWSRGNGWVLAGLARVLENMPTDNPDRQKFVNQFKDMAAEVASLQQPDGSWHASLLDPDSYPIKETSGTGFYCYAILWGINHGVLSTAQYLPVAKKAWITLVTSVQPDGMLGYVQPIGGSPDKVTEQSNEVYGTGAFLLAGAQLYEYINKHHGRIASGKAKAKNQ
ncbi:MAG TPA: glycoside hydrolase family 88 protein [Mucilaginibacter sp.]|jgi:rhamnogalacturonyl hydrolase YesR